MNSHVVKKISSLTLGSSMLILSMLPAASAFAATAPSVTLTDTTTNNNLAAQVQPGQSVTFQANASGISSPRYQFWVEQPDGNWVDAQNYSSSNTFTLSNVQAGNYLVAVDVLSAAQLKAGDYSAAIQPLADGVFVDSSVAISPTTAQVAQGQAITVTATASNIFHPVYQFWYETPSGQWVQDPYGYSTANTYTFVANQTGTYHYIVYAKSPLAVNSPEGALYSVAGSTTVVANVPTLSNIQVTGNNVGTGSVTAPAVTYGTSMGVAATLEDAAGNPLPGVNLTLQLQGSSQPVVTSDGMTLNGSMMNSMPSGWTYQVATNSSGVASATISVGAGVSASYVAQFSAPYQENGTTLTDNATYLEFVPSNTVGIAPFGTSTSPYEVSVSNSTNPTSGLVPITVTLPPLNGAPQSNTAVTFNRSGVGYFATSGGTILGNQAPTVYTNANGQATVYVNSDSVGTATITATGANSSEAASTVIEWGQPGIPAQLANVTATNITGGSGTSTSPYTANAGSNVTVSAVAEDVLGNPVPDAQLLITSTGGQGKWVLGTATTAFPDATPTTGSTVTASGAPFGELVTANSSGQFSFTVTDSTDNDVFNVYPVANGAVTSGTLGSVYLDFNVSNTSIAAVGVSSGNGLAASWAANGGAPNPSVSGLETSVTSLTSSGTVSGTPMYLEFGAFNAANNDYLYGQPSGTVTYQLSASNKGFIDAVDGVKLDGSISGLGLPNKPSAITVSVEPAPGASGYEVLVNGVEIGTFSATVASGKVTIGTVTAVSGDGFALPTDVTTTTSSPFLLSAINVGVGDTTAQTTTVTATANGQTASGSVTFEAQAAASVTSFPAALDLTNGAAQTISYTVQDVNGNPVADAPTTIVVDQANTPLGLWITAVNGQTLETTVSGVTYATPIPLSSAAAPYSVSVPGVALWGEGDATTTVYSNSQGQVSLTLVRGPIAVWNGSTTGPALETFPSNGATPSGTANAYTFNGSSYNSTYESTYGQVYITSTNSVYQPANSTQISQITW
ncbi:beta strand repeat-containing protein [Sulfobacillus thermosulfidooxidans]|uniref:beta strand repeat-containing protein n=1 Tax=Sulfobacillus thermosulfidooxidans TaxID=28034 RepID=UPI00048DF169|nr:hypothetical protein [Sulfobacillus thermosulfidooxidans]